MPVDRRCDQCEYSRTRAEHITLECREGPERLTVFAEHWCYRFRVAERLTGNKDARETDTAPAP
jgi:hypothetical protein